MMNTLIAFIVVGLFPADRTVADRLFKEMDFAGARTAYEKLLEEADADSERAAILDRIGMTWLMQGAYWESEARFRASLELEPVATVYLHRAQAYFYAGQESAREPGAVGAEVRALMNDAIADLRRGLALDPKLVDAWLFLAYCERYRFEADSEAEAYRKVLELSAGHPAASLGLSVLLERAGKPREALEVLNAVATGSRSVEHWIALGRISARSGDSAGSRAAYREAAVLAPDDERSFYALWTATRLEKRFREFESEMGAVLSHNPGAWLPQYYLGFCFMNDGEPAKAIAAFRKVTVVRPDWQDPLYRIAEITRTDLKDEEGSVEAYLEVLEKDPRLTDARLVVDLLAGKRFQSGRLDDAMRLFLALRKAEPGGPRHLLNMALVEKERRRFDEALALYREGEDAFPFEPLFANDRGLLLMALGREDEAFDAFREALDRDPEDLNALENLGAYSRLRGQYDEALAFFRRACEVVAPGSEDSAKFRRYLDMVARERTGVR